jgi:periplasmic protein TonB
LEAIMPTAIEIRETERKENKVPKPVWRDWTPGVGTGSREIEPNRLFADVLLESGSPERARRKVAASLSFALQCMVIGMVLLIPLMYTEELPRQQLLTFLVAPPPPPPPPPPPAAAMARVARTIQSEILGGGALRAPSRIPSKVQMISEDQAPPPDFSGGGVVGGVPGGVPGGQLGGVIGGIINSVSNTAIIPKISAPVMPRRVRVSTGVTAGLLMKKVEPKYPVLAKAARVQGEVVLSAIISKEGKIENLALVSGHPMLVPAAIEAVSRWEYRPYLLNGQPVEVESNIIVTFLLSQ